MRLIAFVTAPSEGKTILAHLGEPTTPPEVARARGPPLWEQAPEPMGNSDEAPAPVPEFIFDQRVSWWLGAHSRLPLPSPSHRLDGHALLHPPQPRRLTRMSSRCRPV
jgi:hypothetical protein